MARPRTFDEEQALDAAMRAFWANGYEGTSTRDLCAATGLAYSSIYNTFISKRALFVRALGHYLDTAAAQQAAILDSTDRDPLQRVRELMGSFVRIELDMQHGGRRIGCLAVNTTIELAADDAEIAQLLDRDTRRRMELLTQVIAQGQREGVIAARRDAALLAAFVNAAAGGMRVAARGGATDDMLRGIAESTIDALAP